MFSQEKMAHSAYLGTMYLTNTTFQGNHDCDDDTGSCCVSNYHMCTWAEMTSGREIEFTGNGRNTTIYGVRGDVDVAAGNGLYDCAGYSSALSFSSRISAFCNICKTIFYITLSNFLIHR